MKTNLEVELSPVQMSFEFQCCDPVVVPHRSHFFLPTLQVKGVFSPISPCRVTLIPSHLHYHVQICIGKTQMIDVQNVFEVWGVVDPKYIPCCVLSKLTVIQLNLPCTNLLFPLYLYLYLYVYIKYVLKIYLL